MWKFLASLILVLIIIPILPAYSQTVFWDRDSYGIGEIALLTLESEEANKNPAIKDLVYIWVYSDTDPTGIQLLVLETGSNDGIFENEIEFGNITNDSTLKVSEGDYVFAKYEEVEAMITIQGTVPELTVKTDSLFQKGDTIKIEGSISNKVYDPNLLVVVKILDPDGSTVFSSQKNPTSQGTYATFTTAGGPSWIKAGEYTVLVQYGSIKAATAFSYSGPYLDKESFEEHVVPWGLVAKAISSSQIELKWNPPTQTFGLDVVGYNISEKIGSGMYEEITTTSDYTRYVISELERGKTYTFVVQARYSTGISEPSEEISVTTVILENATSVESPISKVTTIPEWIRNNAKWWAEGSIGDSDFTSGIQFLIKEGIITMPETKVITGEGSQEIPSWIKNNAEWWSQGLISDDDFVRGIQYLVENGIIVV